jgi:hypothetical protein
VNKKLQQSEIKETREIFGLQRDGVSWRFRVLYNEKLRDFYISTRRKSTQDVMYDGVDIYSRSDSGDEGCVHNFGGEMPRKAAAWEDRQGNERLILRWILGNRLRMKGVFSWFRIM